MPPIVRLAAAGRASVAEEPLWFCIGAQAEILEMSDSGAPDAIADVAGEIEHRVLRALRRREVTRVGRIVRKKTLHKLRADFIVRLPDRRAERRSYSVAIGADPLHRGDRRLDHPGERATPTGMCGADYGRIAIGKQQRSAIGGRYSDRQSRHLRHNCVRPRAVLARPWLVG